jgi:hypothetical protein
MLDLKDHTMKVNSEKKIKTVKLEMNGAYINIGNTPSPCFTH